jgi:putative restriction endonuclease
MLWLEMSRDDVHGGGSWAFGQSLWSPSRKTHNTKWVFWETLLRVDTDDPVLHLRGKGDSAAFVAFSTAAADGFETSDRPPSPGEWGYAPSFYRVPLRDFTPLADPMLLRDVFRRRDTELRSYFTENKAASRKERLFYVIQGGRLQCLNGAYLSEASSDLAELLLDRTRHMPQHSSSVVREVSTGERLRELLTRVGQRAFSDTVRDNYGTQCCFPDCDVAERTFLRGSHIARWADQPELRGEVSNGLCLCLMHDEAFERGLFTVHLELRVWVDSAKAGRSPRATAHLLPHHRRQLRRGLVPPSEEALLQHWERTSCYPS